MSLRKSGFIVKKLPGVTAPSYYVGYSEVYHVNSEEQGKYNSNIKDIKPIRRQFPDYNFWQIFSLKQDLFQI
jgi:hypothetical protein